MSLEFFGTCRLQNQPEINHFLLSAPPGKVQREHSEHFKNLPRRATPPVAEKKNKLILVTELYRYYGTKKASNIYTVIKALKKTQKACSYKRRNGRWGSGRQSLGKKTVGIRKPPMVNSLIYNNESCTSSRSLGMRVALDFVNVEKVLAARSLEALTVKSWLISS